MKNYLLSLHKITSRWLLLTLVILGGAALPAQAVSYIFPDLLPPGCSVELFKINTYSCGVLTLASNDTITMLTKPITINFSGAFTTGTGTQINVGGNASDLNLVLAGVLNVGENAHLIANVTTTAAVNLGANSEVAGSITTTTTTGIVTTGAKTTVGGAINAAIGAVTIGPNSTVNGTITAYAGVVTIGANSYVYGDIQGGDGAINMGANSAVYGAIFAPVGVITIESNARVYGNITGGLGAVTTGSGVTLLDSASIPGNITTTAGVVTLGPHNTVGNITTGAGGITIGNHTVAGTISSPTGVITILNHVDVTSITSGAGAVNIETGSRVCGNIIVTGAGIVTLTTNVKVGGNISTNVGAITVGAGSTVNGDVIITGAGVLTMTSVEVGGKIATVAGAITLTNSRVGGTVGASGAGVVTLTKSSTEDQTLIIPPACGTAIIPGMPISGSTATGLFDCLETDKQKSSLYTKLAGTAFTFDIAALKTDKTLESNYVAVGGTSKTVRVELFDDTSPPASCVAYANPVAVKTATFTSSSGGRTLASAFNLSGVYKKLRCRVTECTDSSCANSSATAEQSCSSDQFSVRPVAVALTSFDANASGIAPLATSTQVIKAGANFNFSAVTASTDNYSGLLTLDASKLKAQNPIDDTVKTYDGVVGALTSILTANAAISNATYSEVGYLYLAQGAYRDDEFTKVDSDNGDCISIASASSSLNDNNLSAVLINGQYGCSIGNMTEVSLGRFIPDHFGVTGSVITRSELQTTELQKIPFTYMDEPMQLNLTVTAYNKNEGATQNYQGKFARLNTTDWGLANWTCSAISDVQCMGLSATHGTTWLTDRLALDTTSLNSKAASNTTTPGGSINGWSTGSSNFTVNSKVTRKLNTDGKVTPDGPFDALILSVKPQDLDGVTLPPSTASDSTHCVDLNAKTGVKDLKCPFAGADEIDLRRKVVETNVRFGRLSISNAYGSELQALSIPVEAQYWNGSSFIRNIDDNNTHLVDKNIIVGNINGALAAIAPPTPTFGTADANGSCFINSALNGVMSNGKSCILFAAPLASGSVDLLINLGSVGLSNTSCLSSTLRSSGSSTSANMSYLSGNWCGENYDRDPTAHVTFGIYKDNSNGKSRLIYFREVY